MGFNQKWLEMPPELPEAGTVPNTNLRQFASYLRVLFHDGTIPEAHEAWLVGYEERFTRPEARVTTPLPLPEPPAQPDPLPAPVSAELAGALKEIANSIKELRTGYAATLEKIDTAYAQSLDKLNEGNERVYGGFEQLVADHRSLHGIVFTHMEGMHKNANESMSAYRTGVLAEAKASSVISAAAQSGSGDPLSDEAGRAVMNLLVDGVKSKMGLGVPPPAAPPGGAAPEVKK